ncbi:hypothetical protein b3_0148 [Synechococcus phage B3]|nr:hypothetical protein b3_0148 [Synechococcus phage B3]QGT54762.1 hypothetical protein b23_0147 [Synechococcus phage B23]
MTETNCWATFHGNGGYDIQQTHAKNLLNIGQKYKVTGASVGSWITFLKLDGVVGSFNSVMFDVEGELPHVPMHGYYPHKVANDATLPRTIDIVMVGSGVGTSSLT